MYPKCAPKNKESEYLKNKENSKYLLKEIKKLKKKNLPMFVFKETRSDNFQSTTLVVHHHLLVDLYLAN